MFGWEFPPFISGGLGTACYGLTRGLVENGVGVTFVLPKIYEDNPQSHVNLISASNITVKSNRSTIESFEETIHFLNVDSPLMPYLSPAEYSKMLKRLRENVEEKQYNVNTDLTGTYGPDLISEIIRYSFVAGMIAANNSFDIIHAHDWMTYLAGIEARRVSGKPLVIHVHATEFDRSGDHVNQEVYDIERKGMDAADRIIAVSYLTRDILINRYGVPAEKIRVVHNAVSKEKTLERLGIKRNLNEKIVLFLGRITFQKGPDYFIEAAKKVIERLPNVRFVMAGSGDMFPRMVERVAQLRLGKYFHFTGFLNRKDVERMYATSDLYVMPSVSEPFGISPLEAMLYNVPVIVSRQSGVAEILEHAVTVDFWDTDRLASSIITILSKPELTQKLIEADNKKMTEIKWEQAAEKITTVYSELPEPEKVGT